mmetsp:Transcript_50246/g.90178  ORF Transcript_50246/g.90178 Transcript_50246/m.90178 type:complete len:392 (-) Transcript_50246:358-1533(-)
MSSKMASLAVIGAGAYGASVAFNVGIPSKSAPTQPSLRGSSSAPSNSLTNAALTATGVFVAAGAVAGKRTSRRGVPVRAGAEDEELLFQPGERVTITGPPAMAGKQGSVVGPALGDAFAIRFDSGSVFNIEIHNIQGSGVAAPAAAAPAATTSYAAPAAMAPAASGDDEELLFQPGERVTLSGPPAMAGKQGSVVGPALGDAFAIRFDSGSVFNIEIHNIQGSGVAPPAAATSYAAPAAVSAPASSGDDEDLLFQPGERVTITGPPAMAGKQGSVVGPALGDAFAIRFDSGSVFNIEIHIIQGSGVAPPAAAAPATSYAAPAAAPAASGDSEELEFQPGQKVEITGPPAMAGKRGEVIGPALSNAFAVRFESGSVFNIETGNIRALSMAMA